MLELRTLLTKLVRDCFLPIRTNIKILKINYAMYLKDSKSLRYARPSVTEPEVKALKRDLGGYLAELERLIDKGYRNVDEYVQEKIPEVRVAGMFSLGFKKIRYKGESFPVAKIDYKLLHELLIIEETLNEMRYIISGLQVEKQPTDQGKSEIETLPTLLLISTEALQVLTKKVERERVERPPLEREPAAAK